MKAIRAILKPILLLFEKVTAPKAMVRAPDAQAKVDLEAAKLVIYQFEACPFCIKVRQGVRRLGLKIELRNVNDNEQFEKELVAGGGELQVPCLRIQKDDGSVQWMYESSDILRYLESRFSQA